MRRRRSAASPPQTRRPGSVSRVSAGWRRIRNGASRPLPTRPVGGSRVPVAGRRTRREGSRPRALKPGSALPGPAEGPHMRSGDSRLHPGRPAGGSREGATGLQPARNAPRRPQAPRRFTQSRRRLFAPFFRFSLGLRFPGRSPGFPRCRAAGILRPRALQEQRVVPGDILLHHPAG